MKGILADVNIEGQVDYLMALARGEPWGDLWQELELGYATFGEVGLDHDATDAEIWHCCQREKYLLITDNRNRDGSNSLEATIRSQNTDRSLPVLTISSSQQLRHSRKYAEEVVVSLFRILIDIEALRGTGRLYLP